MQISTNKTKKLGQILRKDSLIEKYKTISIRFKICISQFIAKILLEQQSLNQIRHCLTGQNICISMTCKIKISQS